ncbi:MAG: DUF6285 domain-containing protein [Candidatus Binatia bacterium]|nr:DUF6285 domain-containing protein [Candidatus Binatia bacterium]
MQDRPTIDELLGAVERFLEREIVPQLHGRDQFHARVAANVLAIVRRELALETEQLQHEWQRLARLRRSCESEPAGSPADVKKQVRRWTEELCEWIRNAPIDSLLEQKDLWQHLEATTREKLLVANPRLVEDP